MTVHSADGRIAPYQQGGMALSAAVMMSDAMGGRTTKGRERPSEGGLRHGLKDAQVGGQLSADWVEWLMGWPIGWTDCERAATGQYRLWLREHGAS